MEQETKQEGNGSTEALTPPIASEALVEAHKARAIQQVQGSILIAQKFPRDEIQAETRIIEACRRYRFAETALWAFPRGGQNLTGPSIRMAETMARYWGHLDFGFVELERNINETVVETFCWDLQTNVRQTRIFTVPHKIALKGGKFKHLTDPRDIYELLANNAQRRVRACILNTIPSHIVDAAVEQVTATLKAGEKVEPLIDRVRKMVKVFAEAGVTKDHLAKRLGHDVEQTTAEELVDLQAIFRAIKDGQQGREQYFDFGHPVEGGAAEKINKKYTRGKVAPASEPEDEKKPLSQDEQTALDEIGDRAFGKRD